MIVIAKEGVGVGLYDEVNGSYYRVGRNREYCEYEDSFEWILAVGERFITQDNTKMGTVEGILIGASIYVIDTAGNRFHIEDIVPDKEHQERVRNLEKQIAKLQSELDALK